MFNTACVNERRLRGRRGRRELPTHLYHARRSAPLTSGKTTDSGTAWTLCAPIGIGDSGSAAGRQILRLLEGLGVGDAHALLFDLGR